MKPVHQSKNVGVKPSLLKTEEDKGRVTGSSQFSNKAIDALVEGRKKQEKRRSRTKKRKAE